MKIYNNVVTASSNYLKTRRNEISAAEEPNKETVCFKSNKLTKNKSTLKKVFSEIGLCGAGTITLYALNYIHYNKDNKSKITKK